MAELPRFTANASVQPGPLADESQMYESYARMFGKIAEDTQPIAQSFLDQYARERGAQAGTAENFEPGIAIGEAGKEFQETALSVNKYTTGADVLNHLTQFHNKAMANVSDDSIQEFNANVQGYAQGVLKTVPAQNRAYITQLLSYKATKAQSSLMTQLRHKQNINANLEFGDQTETYLNNMNDDIQRGNLMGATKTSAGYLQHVDQLALSGAITPEKAEQTKRQFHQDYVHFSAQSHVAAILNDDKLNPEQKMDSFNNFVDGYRDDPKVNSVFTPAQIHSQINGFKEQVQNKYNQVGASKAQNHLLENNILEGALRGQQPNQTQLSMVLSGMMPDEATIFNNKQQTYQAVGSQLGLMKSAPLALSREQIEYNNAHPKNPVMTVSDHLDQMESQLAGIDYTKPNASIEAEALGKGIKMARQIANDRFNDKAKYIQQSPGYQNLVSQLVIDPEHHNMQELGQYIVNQQKLDGIAPSQMQIMANNDAQNYARQFSTLGQAQKIQLANQIAELYGPNAGIAFQNIERQGKLNMDLGALYAVANNAQTQSNTDGLMASMSVPHIKLNQMMKDSGFKPENIRQGVMSKMSATMGVFMNQSHMPKTAFDKPIATATNYAMYLISQDVAPDKAEQQAADAVFNQHYNNGTFNGVMYAIPVSDSYNNSIDPTDTKIALKLAAENAFTKKFAVNPNYPNAGLTDDARAKQYHDDVEAKGYWVNKGNQGYQYVDEYGAPVMVQEKDPKTGKMINSPVIVNYSDLSNAGSPLMQQVNQEVANVSNTATKKNIFGATVLKGTLASQLKGDPNLTFAKRYLLNRPLKTTHAFKRTDNVIIKAILDQLSKGAQAGLKARQEVGG